MYYSNSKDNFLQILIFFFFTEQRLKLPFKLCQFDGIWQFATPTAMPEDSTKIGRVGERADNQGTVAGGHAPYAQRVQSESEIGWPDGGGQAAGAEPAGDGHVAGTNSTV